MLKVLQRYLQTFFHISVILMAQEFLMLLIVANFAPP